MVKVVYNTVMALNILETFNLIEKMDLDWNILVKTNIYIRVIIKKITNMDRERLFGLMEVSLKETLFLIKNLGMEF